MNCNILNNLADIFTKNTTQNTTTNTIIINLPRLRHRITRVTATLPWYIIPSPRPFDHCVIVIKHIQINCCLCNVLYPNICLVLTWFSMSVFGSLTFPLRRSRVRPGRGCDRFYQALDQFVVVVAHVNTVCISCAPKTVDLIINIHIIITPHHRRNLDNWLGGGLNL